MCVQDQRLLKRFLDDKDVKELPSEEEPWEVPMPVDTRPELSGTDPQKKVPFKNSAPSAGVASEPRHVGHSRCGRFSQSSIWSSCGEFSQMC